MKKLFYLFLLSLWPSIILAQNTYELKYDSVIVGKTTSSSIFLRGKVWMRGLTVGLSTDSVLVFRSGKVFKVPRSQFSSGGVSSVASANADIGVATGTTTAVLTLNSGVGASQIVKRDGAGGVGFNIYNDRIYSSGQGIVNYDAGTVSFGVHNFLVNSAQLAFKINTDRTLTAPLYASGNTSPTQSGTKHMLTVDANGLFGHETIPGGGGSTNLALGTTTSTTQPITNSNGTGFTLPSATTSLAGLMSAADKTKLNGISENPTLDQVLTAGNVSELGINVSTVVSGGIQASSVAADTYYAKTRTVTTNTTLFAIGDYAVRGNAAGGSIIVDLPTAASAYAGGRGVIYVVKKIDSSGNTVTLKANGSELIDGSNTKVINMQYSSIMVQSNGTSWDIL